MASTRSSRDGDAHARAFSADKIRKEYDKFDKLVHEYSDKLDGIVDALEQMLVSDVDPNMAPMKMDLMPYESLTVLQLVNTKNKTFNKVLMALSSLCIEVETLKADVRAR